MHQPWWGDYRQINDAFARIGMMLAEGKASAEVLVLHPLSTAWMHYSECDRLKAMEFYTEGLKRLTVELDSLQIPHHYADEVLTSELGFFEDGKIRIGRMAYSLVVIPQLVNLSSQMLTMLEKFTEAGGIVLVVRNRLEPEKLTVDGEPASQQVRDWFASLPAYDSEAAAAETVADLLPDRVRITEHGVPARRVVGTFRDFDNLEGRSGRMHFITNLQYNQPCSLTIALPRTGRQVEVIDPFSGKFSILSGVRHSGNHLVFDYPLAAGEAAIFFVSPHPEKHAPKIRVEDVFALEPVRRLDSAFTVEHASENLFTLDRCRYRVDGGEWIDEHVCVIHARLLRLRRPCDLEMEFRFNLAPDFDFSAPLSLVAETPERCEFALNGHRFDAVDSGAVFDQAFRRIPLPAALIGGVNVLSIRTRYNPAGGGLRQARTRPAVRNRIQHALFRFGGGERLSGRKLLRAPHRPRGGAYARGGAVPWPVRTWRSDDRCGGRRRRSGPRRNAVLRRKGDARAGDRSHRRRGRIDPVSAFRRGRRELLPRLDQRGGGRIPLPGALRSAD